MRLFLLRALADTPRLVRRTISGIRWKYFYDHSGRDLRVLALMMAFLLAVGIGYADAHQRGWWGWLERNDWWPTWGDLERQRWWCIDTWRELERLACD